MRRLLIALLCAGVAQPAIASTDRERGGFRSQERGEPDRSESRSERAPADSPRADRSERGGESERPAAPRVDMRRADNPRIEIPRADNPRIEIPRTDVPRADRVARERLGGMAPADLPEAEHGRGALRPPPALRSVSSNPAPDREASPRTLRDTVREWRSTERRRDDSPATIEERNLRRAPSLTEGGGLVEPTRPIPRVLNPDRVLDRDRRDGRQRRISVTPAPGTEPPAPTFAREKSAETAHRWRRDWRHDRRFDWRDHRRRHHSHFRLGVYLDPFGWNYHRYGIGWRLWPSYYRSSYWLNDPWSYRLPPAYGPYRWIRYHDDALLVNLYTGEVVDVIYDFFW